MVAHTHAKYFHIKQRVLEYSGTFLWENTEKNTIIDEQKAEVIKLSPARGITHEQLILIDENYSRIGSKFPCSLVIKTSSTRGTTMSNFYERMKNSHEKKSNSLVRW